MRDISFQPALSLFPTFGKTHLLMYAKNAEHLFCRQMMHDPSIYSDPMEFNPSRFLKEEGRDPEPDPRDVFFGFGRRLVFPTCQHIR